MDNLSGNPAGWNHDPRQKKRENSPVATAERREPADLKPVREFTEKALAEARTAYGKCATRDVYDVIVQLEGALLSMAN